MGLAGISKSQVSKLGKDIDERASELATRTSVQDRELAIRIRPNRIA